MTIENQHTTEYREEIKVDYEEIKVDYEEIKIHKEDTNYILYETFWESDELKSLRAWPQIKIVRDSPNIDDYFKMEFYWDELPHNEITININDDVQYTFDANFTDYEFLSIDSSKNKINVGDLQKINVGIFAAFNNSEIALNRSREITLMHPGITNNHSLNIDESLLFKSLNEVTILNHDPNDLNNYPKYNKVELDFNILKTQGLWSKIANISIKNDDSDKELYTNQISDLSLSNLVFGDKTDKISLILVNNDEKLKEIVVDEVTKYDYKRKNTYKEPSISGEKGYVIPYSWKGDFFPILNISINGYFKDFKITIPHYFNKAFLDENNGNVVMKTGSNDFEFDTNKDKHKVVVDEDDFDKIIKEDLTLEGILNLAD